MPVYSSNFRVGGWPCWQAYIYTTCGVVLVPKKLQER